MVKAEQRQPRSQETQGTTGLSQFVQAELLPPERFKGQLTGKVSQIERIKGTVVVLLNNQGFYDSAMFDDKGDFISIQLDPSKDSILRAAKRNYIAPPGVYAQNYAEKLSTAVGRLGFSDREAEDIANKLNAGMKRASSRYNPGVVFLRDDILSQIDFRVEAGEWKVEIRKTPDNRDLFVYSVGDTHIGVDPSEPNARIAIDEAGYAQTVDLNPPLAEGLRVNEKGSVFILTDEKGKEVVSYAGSGPVEDPTSPQSLYFINTGQIYSVDLEGVGSRKSTPRLQSQISVPDPVELKIDPNGNFLIVRSKDNTLSIVDKETGEVAKTIPGVKGPIEIDQQGDILFVDENGKLREIQTNFQAIPTGGTEAARKQREKDLKALQERFERLELKGRQRRQSGITEDDVAATLRQTIARQVQEQIATAKDPATVEEVLDRLQMFRTDPDNASYTAVVDEFIGQARDRLSGIKSEALGAQIDALTRTIEGVQSVGDTLSLDSDLARIFAQRQGVEITDLEKRREIDQKIRSLQASKEVVVNKYQGELVQAINTALPTIETLVRETGSAEELAAFGSSAQAQEFELMLVNVRDPQARRELRDRYQAVKNEQLESLGQKARALEEQQRLQWAQVIEESRADLTALRQQIEELKDTTGAERFDRNPLVTVWRSKLLALPPELREEEEKRLEILLSSRKKDLQHRRELGAVGESGELKFGNTSFPVYKEPPRVWQPKLVPIPEALPGYADLIFEDSQGRVFHPNGDKKILVNADLSNPQTQAIIERYRNAANDHFEGMVRKVPEFDENWRITQFHMEKLEEITEALNLQLVGHRGVLLLQGEAGTGKNVLVDILANLSNREVIPILCNENSVKEDLTYEFYYDPEKGTYKLPSKLVEGIQTPGAIILFDEINALKPGVAKMLNSLFDYRRRIFIPEGGKGRELIADPSVIFIGTMNPQNYAGVNRLSPEVKSRARVVDLDYPPFELHGQRTRYRSDEAEMMAAYMDPLRELTQEEIRLCWNYLHNRDTTNGADRILASDPQIEADLRRIYDVIRVATALRRMYEEYQIGDSNEPMDFPTSLREVVDIAMEMNHKRGVKPIIKRVIIPKIDDRRQKRMVEQTIDSVMPEG